MNFSNDNPRMMPRRRALVQLLATTTLAVSAAAFSALPGVAQATASAASDSAGTHGVRTPANAVVHWNKVALDAFAPIHGTNSIGQSRVFAILQAAVHDALNAIDRRYASYTRGVPAAPDASVDAAVATAARDVLVKLLPPEQAPLVEAAYERALQAIADGPEKTTGVATGQAAARVNLERRLNDGADGAGEPVYIPTPQPGDYQFTEPFDFAFLPGWGRVQPFVISLQVHRLPGPLPVSSAAYARDWAAVKAIGDVNSHTRTAEQGEIARFWYEDSPLGWNRIANTTAQRRKLDEWDAARTFALVNFAMADGFVAGFAEKYEHRFWRPVTAIRAAADDGNRLTQPDPAWQPLLVTPPVPDYPSTHTVLGWAAAEVLIGLFGDRAHYETTSLTLPGVTRSFRSFSQAADENGASRIYAGIHFKHAVKAGRAQGRGIGQAVVANALPALMP